MPPSPALRCSPRRELRVENSHKRGRSLESGFLIKEKDDDLALFSDMQNSESDNFFLQSADDLNDSIAKLRYDSGIKLRINIPARGENNDLLNVDGEKNDYDWLLTPPDTPLFPSLDDEEPQPLNQTARGRQQTQPISIRSSMFEKPNRTSRSSPSPHRLSPSPRSSTGVIQTRVSPSRASHSRSTAILRPPTPSRRPSTPPTKSSTLTPRSSTPTLQRMSDGSNGHVFSGRKGTSSIRVNRGNSASPKLRGWQTNPSGFSSNPPLNLHTSLAERPSSITRGLSPASRNGHQSMLPSATRNRRQSMSPTASRSASSSHSHERDFSSYGKASVASSGDDDVDSLCLSGMAISCNPTGGENGVVANSRAMAFSKKPVRTLTSSSAPKTYLDSAWQQMDHWRNPQHMFRPLLSSVPTSTFYAGKVNNPNRPMLSRNSSLTTSSNASSEQGASVVPDIDIIDYDQNDLDGDCIKLHDLESQGEIFVFDKMAETTEGGIPVGVVDLEELEKSSTNIGDTASMAATSESSYAAGNPSKVDCHGILATCSNCGNQFRILEVGLIPDVCEECVQIDGLSAEGATQNALVETQNEELSLGSCRKDRSNEIQHTVEVSEYPDENAVCILPSLHDTSNELVHDFLSNSSGFVLDVDTMEQAQAVGYEAVKPVQAASQFQEPREVAKPSTRMENLEGAGISVLLLQRSGSSKWPVVQGRQFAATSMLCSELSYTRDHASPMKRSISRDSASASSSVDLGSSRQSEHRVQRQLSIRKGEIEHLRNDCHAKTDSTALSYSISCDSYDDLVCSETETEKHNHSSVDPSEFEGLHERVSFDEEPENSLEDTESGCTNSLVMVQAVVDGYMSACGDSCMEMGFLQSELLSHSENMHASDSSAKLPDGGECNSCINSEVLINNEMVTQDTNVQVDMQGSSVVEEEKLLLNDGVCGKDVCDVACCSSVSEPKIDLQNVQGSPCESTSSHDSNNKNLSDECTVSSKSEKDLLASALESETTEHSCGKSIVTVEGLKGQMSRSLTLEEATDTILLCSSIIHDLAYKAVTLGMEKEDPLPIEPLCPTIATSGNQVPYQKVSLITPSKRSPKPQKSKRKRLENVTNTMILDSGNEVKALDIVPSNTEAPSKDDSAKPPKPEAKCNCTIM